MKKRTENRKKRYLLFPLLLILALLALSLYEKKSDRSKENYSMIYIPKVEDEANDFWETLIQGAVMAAEDYGVDLQILAPDSETNLEQQESYLKEAIAMAPDAILISPQSVTESNALLKQAKDAGIHVIFIDSYVSEPVQDLIIATDNVVMGEELGAYAATFLEEDSEIVMVGHVQNSSTAIEREQGIRSGLGSFEKNVRETVFCGSQFSVAYDQTTELLKKYPDLDMVIGMNEYSTVGAARAVRDMGRQSEVMVLGIDNSLETIQLMEEGVIRAIMLQMPFNMGYLGVEETIHLLNREKIDVKYINSGTKLIETKDIYTEENQKLLFPFSGKGSFFVNFQPFFG
ncbi:MAG: substrate-binding domain-containing protein [Eubacteriales bacterium]|nr:substrate-binding domain-containing protein [Eubacteriales bacterium]